MPKSAIPPEGTAGVEVIFRPGSDSGVKSVNFAVRTDDPDRPTIELTLSAHIHPQWEFLSVDGSPTSIVVGRDVRRAYRGVGHGQAGERPLIPVEIAASGEIVASLTGRDADVTLPGGLAEAKCEISINLPASKVPGLRREELVFRWADGRIERRDFAWVVNPAITAVPSALVFHRSTSGREVRTIRLQSAERPFRILSVGGVKFAAPVTFPADSSLNHKLDLEFDTANLRPGVDSLIRIETDHADSPHVDLGILIFAATGETSR